MPTDIRAAALLPHGPPMALLEQMTEVHETGITCSLTVRPGMPYADAVGNLPVWMGLELMAQATAAWKTHHARQGNAPPEIGFLMGVRELTANVPHFSPGSVLEVQVEQVVNLGRMGQMVGTIRTGGAELVTATFSAYLPTPEELDVLTAGTAPPAFGGSGRAAAGQEGTD